MENQIDARLSAEAFPGNIRRGPAENGSAGGPDPWSQARENFLNDNSERPTLLFNGYGEQVASLYRGLDKEALYM